MNYGALIAGRFTIPITYVGIVGGSIRLTAVRTGPLPAYSGTGIVTGLDGVPLSGAATLNVSWPEVDSGINLVIPIVLSNQLSERPVLQGRVESEAITRKELT